MADRSTSRSRDPVASSGRGGLGNIRPASTSQDRPLGGPDDFSSTRGREPAVAIGSEVRSTGRGGAGNLRSPSRDPAGDQDVRDAGERAAIRTHEQADREGPVALAGPKCTRAGRGGAGNIVAGAPPPYERGRSKAAAPVDGVHSTGRGGLANLTSSPAPPPETLVHHLGVYESSGRGGAGNMSTSRERGGEQRALSGSRERGTSKDHAGGVAGLWNRIHGGHGHAHPETIRESGPGQLGAGAEGVDIGVGGGGRGAI
ncbi:hypothetical protein B0H14DRAFT_3870674 [Mycena olivaceomarginata]|nr:hypothetical protein B0H14DRAFT_3870674 [Mycena olivaceomarginata]